MSLLQRFETLHPATRIMLWLVMVLALQWLSLPALLWFALVLFPLTWRLAGPRFKLLLRRTRWLLLSIAVLFLFATPGTPLPGPASTLGIGITQEGLAQAAVHALRLSQLLAMLALLLERLGIPALIAGLYVLLGAIGLRRQRARMALRLMLVLEYVEQGRQERSQAAARSWQHWFDPQLAPATPATQNEQSAQNSPQPASLTLSITPLKMADRLLMALSLLALLLAYLTLGRNA